MPWRPPSICIWSARISVLYFSTPAWSVHLRVRKLPSTYTCEPLRRYCPTISARRPLNTTRCHSVASRISPVCLSFHLSVVAMVTLATWSPLGKVRISGSRPRLPTMMTLLMDAMLLCLEVGWRCARQTADCAARQKIPAASGGGFGAARQWGARPTGWSVQVSASHSAHSSAVAANRPVAPAHCNSAPPSAPPANRPSDCSVL